MTTSTPNSTVATRTGRWVRRHKWISALIIVVLAASPVWVSAGMALTDQSLGSSVSARFAEWLRDHGGGSVVNWAENVWYSHHPPPVGGAPAKGLIPPPTTRSSTVHPPSSGSATRLISVPPHLPMPKAITPFANPPALGEGQWHPAGRTINGIPAVYEAFMRPDSVHTSVVTGVAWADTKLLRATLYSGSQIPGGGPWADTAPISVTASKSLVAAFNAGFRLPDANGGYFTQGRTVVPLVSGSASFVIYDNGDVQIGSWGSQVTLSPNVTSVRQNLDLIVDNGQPVPGLNANDNSQWGATLAGSVYVWRSGVGITADGALVYAGGPDLNITDLAAVLARAGAVRAMELDINTDWVNFSVYSPASPTGNASPANGATLLATMSGGPARYFESWWSRDFFVLSAREP
jgi:uncharacterized protein YigE (DUF2233 family)